ncbi:hypothetical protein GCM10009527_097590 [Actinomadura nitritigenes]|uniref:Uncharacterized protein n=1 Tax=Actinomadura nitritigenes TaxID=134602 RepID=A0ABS3RFL9_9ACTN|nr:hypothetical protein [Actinomadura nitritigenes]MBO2444905.1 hypothetical protein [Actinomadura nitritigenes]
MTASPAAKLVSPTVTQPMPQAVDISLSLTDFVSPGHWLLWVIDKICGVNPAEWLAQQLAGDWESISKFASSLKHVSEFYTEYGKGLKEGSATMLKDWEGNAAAACGTYFQDFSGAVEKQAEPIQSVADECQSVAFGSWASAKAAVSGLEALLDLALMIAIEAAASAATSWTIVGPSVGMALIMSQIGIGILKWLEILGYVGMTVSAVFAFIGLVSGLLGALHGLEEQQFPKTSYDNKVI